MDSSLAEFLLVTSALSVIGAAAGVFLSEVREIARRIVPLAGGALLLMSLFWILPELTTTFGWPLSPALMFAGFGFVWLIDRFVYPVCPACSHTHDHDSCSARLHGFATPLIAAAIVHSLFDGWTLSAGTQISATSAMAWGVLIHKIPESFAYGAVLHAALKTRWEALGWALAAQACTFAGAVLALEMGAIVGSQWMGVLLALGGGTFLYLGFHAVHGEWKRRTADRMSRLA